jgi:hypothetical protein
MRYLNQNSRAVLPILLLWVGLDAAYSFWQHLHVALDGDMSAIIVPAEKYAQAMHDPLGLGVLSDERYCAPNRFFVHGAMSVYFKQVPLWLQAFVSPVNSVYLACALLKTSLQLTLIWLLSVFAIGGKRLWGVKALVAAALVTPFFQAFGYNLQMGIIEKSITYTFFYPLPLAVLLGYFLAFYRNAHGPMKWPQHLWLLPLTIALPLSGPLVPAVALLVCPLALCFFGWKNYRALPDQSIARRASKAIANLPGALLFYFSLMTFLSLWSLYVGSFNSESEGPAIALLDRYPALLKGLASIFTLKLGFPLLTLGIIANLYLLRKCASHDQLQQAMTVGKWVAVFIAAYLLLLPLGGYRSYRTLIVRHDTILPVTLCLVFYYAKTSLVLLRNEWKHRGWYAMGIALLSLAVTAADLPDFQHNACEKAALETIARSSEKVVKLSSDCPVMGWNDKMADPEGSKLNAQLLQIWRVTDEVRLYYSE